MPVMMRRLRISSALHACWTEQGGGIGRALLLRSLAAMRAEGYAYAVIGGVGPQEFYKKCGGAMLIPDSVPGIYRDFLGGMKE